MSNESVQHVRAVEAARESLRKWVPERSRQRVPAQFPVTFVAGLEAGRQIGVVANVSCGGLFIQSSLLLPVGAALQISLFLPLSAGPKALAAAAWVRWINHPVTPKAAALPPGMGVEFLGLDPASRAALDAFVTEHLRGEIR